MKNDKRFINKTLRTTFIITLIILIVIAVINEMFIIFSSDQSQLIYVMLISIFIYVLKINGTSERTNILKIFSTARKILSLILTLMGIALYLLGIISQYNFILIIVGMILLLEFALEELNVLRNS